MRRTRDAARICRSAAYKQRLTMLHLAPLSRSTEISPTELRIRIEPEEDAIPGVGTAAPGAADEEAEPVEPIKLFLHVTYTPAYPDEPPEMILEGEDEQVDPESREGMLQELKDLVSPTIIIAVVGPAHSWYSLD